MTDPDPSPPDDAVPEPREAPVPPAPPEEPRAVESPPQEAQESGAPSPLVAPRRHRGALPVLSALGFLLLAAGLGWTWFQQETLRQQMAEQGSTAALDPARLAALRNDIDALRQRQEQLEQRRATPAGDVGALEARIGALEQRPGTPSVDLGPLQARLSALEQRPAAPAVDLGPLQARLTALEKRPAAPVVDLGPLEARLSALEKRPPAPAVDLGPLEARVTALEQRPPPTAPNLSGAVAQLTDRIAALEKQIAQSEQAERSVAARAGRIARLQAASAALEAGQPLGELPDAPAALIRFATAPPPTEAALRLSFPEAAKRAEAASEPSTQGESLTERMWQRAQSLVTVRRGDKVVIGAPAATVLAGARARLEAGDLAGAVAALGQLDGPAAQAIADWREQAQALLDARAALAQMAHS
jgi:hypothetical protein